MVGYLNSPWPYLGTAAFVFLIGLFAWKQPRRTGTRYFRLIVAFWIAWALTAALQTIVPLPGLSYGFWVLQSIIALVISPLSLLFALEYTGNEKWLARRSLLLLFFPALLFAVLALSFSGSLVSVVYNSGALEYHASEQLKLANYAYVCILILISVSVLTTCLLKAPAFWAPILLIIIGQVIPISSYAIANIQQAIIPPIHVVILSSNFSAIAYGVALYSFGLLRVVPVARDTVIHQMPYAMIVLDVDNRLVDFNQATQALPGLAGKLKLRQPADRALREWWPRISPLIASRPLSQDIPIQAISGQQHYKVHSIPLLQANGWREGQVLILQDVTMERQAQQQQAQVLWVQATLQEREQLADELHDGLSQSLSFLRLQSQAAQLYLSNGQLQSAQASLARLTEAAGEIQEDTRELIGDLLAVSLPAENFLVTLRQTLSRFEQQTGLAVRLGVDGSAQAPVPALPHPAHLPPPVAVQLIRITQEALANVRKHAQGASHVCVELITKDGQVILSITDDGAGFDPHAIPGSGKHFGLQVMRQRATRIGGDVSVCSAPGKGTRIEVCAPLAPQEIGSRHENSSG